MNDTLVYPPGRALLFTDGEYSDFGTCGAVVTLKTCNLPELVEQFKAEWRASKAESDTYCFGPDPDEFVAWLVAKGHAFPADIEEVHLGNYSLEVQ